MYSALMLMSFSFYQCKNLNTSTNAEMKSFGEIMFPLYHSFFTKNIFLFFFGAKGVCAAIEEGITRAVIQ